MRIGFWLAGMLIVSGPTGIGSAAAAAQPREVVAPMVDHHQHLLGPIDAIILKGVEYPAVSVPRSIGQLLSKRADLWDNPVALRALYTANAVATVVHPPAAGIFRGAPNSSNAITHAFRRPYVLRPVTFHANSSSADLTGYYSQISAAGVINIGMFAMRLERHPHGPWQIATETPTLISGPIQPLITSDDLIAMLDEAGIAKGVVLSTAFIVGSKNMDLNRFGYTLAEKERLVRGVNDWTANQVRKYPSRLVAFFSVNPLDPFAMREFARCAGSASFVGLKLHLDESDVSLARATDVAKLRAIMAAANSRRLPIIIHVGNNAGSDAESEANVRTLLDLIATAAADVPIQIAHLWGGGAFSEGGLAAYANAVSAHSDGTKNLYFDVAEVALVASQYKPDRQNMILAEAAARMRQIGMDHILYGSDGAMIGHLPPKKAWEQFQKDVPLTKAEFDQIAANRAPYLR